MVRKACIVHIINSCMEQTQMNHKPNRKAAPAYMGKPNSLGQSEWFIIFVRYTVNYGDHHMKWYVGLLQAFWWYHCHLHMKLEERKCFFRCIWAWKTYQKYLSQLWVYLLYFLKLEINKYAYPTQAQCKSLFTWIAYFMQNVLNKMKRMLCSPNFQLLQSK
jgi:hypothetical protein